MRARTKRLLFVCVCMFGVRDGDGASCFFYATRRSGGGGGGAREPSSSSPRSLSLARTHKPTQAQTTDDKQPTRTRPTPNAATATYHKRESHTRTSALQAMAAPDAPSRLYRAVAQGRSAAEVRAAIEACAPPGPVTRSSRSRLAAALNRIEPSSNKTALQAAHRLRRGDLVGLLLEFGADAAALSSTRRHDPLAL